MLESLKQKGMLYITLLDNDRVLLCKTTVDIDILTKISNRVYLAAPSTQVFLFLSDEEKQKIFSKDSDYSKEWLRNNFPFNFEEPIGKLLLDNERFRLIVFNPFVEEILKWIP